MYRREVSVDKKTEEIMIRNVIAVVIGIAFGVGIPPPYQH
jgi:hypothetical protein